MQKDLEIFDTIEIRKQFYFGYMMRNEKYKLLQLEIYRVVGDCCTTAPTSFYYNLYFREKLKVSEVPIGAVCRSLKTCDNRLA